MSDSRRGFLTKLGMLATAPVFTAFVDDRATGLAVPDTSIEVAKDVPEAMVISSALSASRWHRGDRVQAPSAMLPIYVNGKRFGIQVFDV